MFAKDKPWTLLNVHLLRPKMNLANFPETTDQLDAALVPDVGHCRCVVGQKLDRLTPDNLLQREEGQTDRPQLQEGNRLRSLLRGPPTPSLVPL